MKSIEIKATEQFVPVVLFMLHWIVLKLESVWNAVIALDFSNERYCAVRSCGTVCIMLYEVVLTFEFQLKVAEHHFSQGHPTTVS